MRPNTDDDHQYQVWYWTLVHQAGVAWEDIVKYLLWWHDPNDIGYHEEPEYVAEAMLKLPRGTMDERVKQRYEEMERYIYHDDGLVQ